MVSRSIFDCQNVPDPARSSWACSVFLMLQIFCSNAVRPFALLCAVLSLPAVWYTDTRWTKTTGLLPTKVFLNRCVCSLCWLSLSNTFRLIYSTCCCNFAIGNATIVGSGTRLRPGDYLEPNAVLGRGYLNVIGVWPRCKTL